jgi:hypothetical protein
VKKLFSLVLAAVMGTVLISAPIGCDKAADKKKTEDTPKKDETKKDK